MANELVLKIIGIDLNDPLYADQKEQLQLAINVLNLIEKKDQARIINIASNPKNRDALIEFLITGKIPAARLASVGLNPSNLLLANRLRKLMEKPEFKEALTKLNASLGSQTPGDLTIIDSNDPSENNEGEGEEGEEGKEKEKGKEEEENKGEGEGNKEKEKEKGEEVKPTTQPEKQTPAPAAATPPNQNTTATTYAANVNGILETLKTALDELLKSSGTVPTEEEDSPTEEETNVEMGPGQPSVQESSEEMPPVPSEEEEKQKVQGGSKSRKNKKRYTKNKKNKNKHKKGTKKNGKKSTRRKSKKN